MKFNFSPKLLFLFGLTLFAVFLIPASVQGQRTCAYTPDANGGDYCQTRTGNFPGTLLESHEVCLPWQTAKIGQVYTFEKVTSCYFDGCVVHPPYIKKVTGLPRYYDNPNYPTDHFAPEEGIASNNITLPIKFDWDEVEGWKDGWMEQEWKDGRMQETLKTCLARYDPTTRKTIPGAFENKCEEIGRESICVSACNYQCDEEQTKIEKTQCEQAQSPSCIRDYWVDKCEASYPSKCENSINFYQIKFVWESGEYKAFSDKSEFIPPSCVLKSGQDYTWQVRGCGSQDETTCGPWGDTWIFSTNLAPELVSPEDPDWSGEKGAENTPLPTTLDWCDVSEAESYQVKISIIEEEEEICHPWLTTKTGCQPLEISRIESEGKTKWLLLSEFKDEKEGYFTKDTHYKWQVGVEIENLGIFFGKMWKFIAGGSVTDFELIFPPNDLAGSKPVELPLVLSWQNKPGTNSFVYEISPIAGGNPNTGIVLPSKVNFNYPQLSLDAFYKWKVWPCWDYAGEQCEEEFKGEWVFKTTGRPPQLAYPTSGEQDIHIPVNFDWEAVPGAKSYVLKVLGDGLNLEKSVEKPGISINYPEYALRQEKEYTWQVKTCAWKDGQTCGQSSPAQNFKTFRLPPPQNPFPENNDQLSTDEKYISWQKVPEAKAYQYKIRYLTLAAAEENEACKISAGQEVISTKIVPTNSDYIQLNCLGGYQWQISSCLDENCTETSNWSDAWTFSLAEPIEVGKGGLVPCGRSTDNLETPWNERELCQVKHIFLLIKVLIDFLLFKLAPLGLVLLTIATGVMFYFSISTGGTSPIMRLKRFWKSAGIGLGIIFFAWLVINIVLKLIGYQIGIFGQWY